MRNWKLVIGALLLFNGVAIADAIELARSRKIITHNVWYGFTKKPEPRHSDWLKWMASQAADGKTWGHEHTVLLKEDGFPTGITSRYPISDVKQIRKGMPHGLLRCRKTSKQEPIFVSEPVLRQDHGAGEGPAWHPKLGLLTSGEGNINLRDKNGKSAVYIQDAGSNGLMFDREGRLVICEPVRRRVSRIEADGAITVLADSFDGRKFNQPNDLAMDLQNRIYFTDPCYGDRAGMELRDESGREIEGVYRIDPDGKVSRIITHEVDRPNGIAVTADDKSLFVADNNNSKGGARKLWRFALNSNGTPDRATQTLIYDWKTTRGPDGMKLDAAGRLYVAAGLNKPNPPHETADVPTAGIYVFSPEGTLLQFVAIPRDETTNCGFGGEDLKTLFVTSGGSLWSLQTAVAGKPVWPAPSDK